MFAAAQPSPAQPRRREGTAQPRSAPREGPWSPSPWGNRGYVQNKAPLRPHKTCGQYVSFISLKGFLKCVFLIVQITCAHSRKFRQYEK